MYKKQQLLCTFTTGPNLNLVLDYINTYYKVSNSKVFLYKEVQENYKTRDSNLLVIYNIDENLRADALARNTILVHRKKHHNSFYTINGLNYLIQRINNGVLDKQFQIDWENFSNKLITVNDNELKITNIFFDKTLNI